MSSSSRETKIINKYAAFAIGVVFVGSSLQMETLSYSALFFCLGIIYWGMAIWLGISSISDDSREESDKTFDDLANAKSTVSRKTHKRIILSGPAGSGKDYLKEGFAEMGIPVEVSYTTRPMREGEVPGKSYFYINEPHFKHLQAQNKFYEAVEFNGAHYGTLRESWETSLLFIMTPSGIAHITEEDREDCIIVYLNIPEYVRRERMEKRSDAGFDKIERRIQADEADFKGFEADFTTDNPNFDREFVIRTVLKAADKRTIKEVLEGTAASDSKLVF